MFGAENSGDQAIDIIPRVVNVETGARGGDDPEAVHQRLVAMVTSTDRDVLFVKNGRDIVRVNAINLEG